MTTPSSEEARALDGSLLSPEVPLRASSEPKWSKDVAASPRAAGSAGGRRQRRYGEGAPWSYEGTGGSQRRGRSERSRSPRRDGDPDYEDEEAGFSTPLPGASMVNLQRQKLCHILEIRADGARSMTQMRMREVMQYVQGVVAAPGGDRRGGGGEGGKHRRGRSSQGGKTKGRTHNALHPRDLRAIDTSHPNNCKNPAIVVRQHVIVANFDPLRAVIVHDRMLVLLPHDDYDLSDEIVDQLDGSTTLSQTSGDDGADDASSGAAMKRAPSAEALKRAPSPTPLVVVDTHPGGGPPKGEPPPPSEVPPPPPPSKSPSATSLSELLTAEAEQPEAQPFELRALEAVLSVCTMRLDDACDRLELPAAQSMDFLTKSRMTLKHLERLRHIKNEVSNLEARARDTAEAISATLDEDEDMCMMRLSLLRERPTIFEPPISAELLTQHDDVELLLESYLQDSEAVQTRLELLRLSIDNAEDLFTMKLDIARNRLITADTIFTLLGMIAAAGALVVGLFGMNLDQHKASFLWVAASTAVVCVVATAAIFSYLLKSNTLVF